MSGQFQFSDLDLLAKYHSEGNMTNVNGVLSLLEFRCRQQTNIRRRIFWMPGIKVAGYCSPLLWVTKKRFSQ